MAEKLSKSNVYLETHYEPGDPEDLEGRSWLSAAKKKSRLVDEKQSMDRDLCGWTSK